MGFGKTIVDFSKCYIHGILLGVTTQILLPAARNGYQGILCSTNIRLSVL
jgi:hypothetical protein